MGEVGSQIICEVFRALILASEPSVLAPQWNPKDKVEEDTTIDSMPSLLKWIDKKEPIINPLKDNRL